MTRTKPFFAILFTLLASAALAQSGTSVKQSGSSVTSGHIPYWVTGGVIADGGTSADSPITSIGVTNGSGAGICVSSDRVTAAGRNQLCFGAKTNGPATISLQNLGTAAAQNLNFVINGTTVTIPTGGGTFIFGNGAFTTTHIPCFANTNGVVQDCGLAAIAGAITSGAWQGTPVAVAFGGTGATTVAGAQAALGLGTMATQNANAVAITGGTITGMPTPLAATDVTNKSYVDSTAQGLIILAQTRLATATVLPNTPTYSNGTLGVGATLTAGSNTTLTVDGVVANLNDVILVKNQAAPAQNGIYTVTTAGGGVPWVLTRATYFNVAAQMVKGSYTFITAGTVNTNSGWVLQTTIATVGTDAVNFNLFSITAAGVTSIGGQTGVVLCGTGVICSAGSITPDYSTTNTWTGTNTFNNSTTLAGGSTLTLPVGGSGVEDPKSGRFLPVVTGTVSGTACSATSPFTCMQFCVYKGNQVLISGVLQQIPAGFCVGSTGGVTSAYNQACIENNVFLTTCGQTLAGNTTYYAYVAMISNVMTMVWSTNQHAPSQTGVTSTFGNEVMSGDPTRSLVGICHTDLSGKFVGTGNRQDCASWFNPVQLGLTVSLSGSFSSATNFTGFGPCSLASFSGCMTWVEFSDNDPTVHVNCVFNQNSGQAVSVTGGIGISTNGSPATLPAATSTITVDNGNLFRQVSIDQSGAGGAEGWIITNFMGLSNGSAVITASSCTMHVPSRIPS